MTALPHGERAVPPAEGDLARLLRTEARLDGELRHAQDEAAALVAAARAAAAAREAALATELDAEGGRLADAIAGERRRRERELTEATDRDVRKFERVTAEQVDALARYVVDRVIGVGHDH